MLDAITAMSGAKLIVAAVLIIILLFLIFTHVRTVPESRAYVIERIGKYNTTWTSGINLLIPFLDKIRKNISLKEQVIDFKPQPVITKDNVTIQIDSVLYFQITDPKLYTYGIENPMIAIENLTATTLRNIIGGMDLEETLTSRDKINAEMLVILDEATDPWGMKITRVELKNIDPPQEIKIAMERQMKADREKREAILRAEGQKQAAILVAEGERESTILRAEAAKEAEILKAEAVKQAMIKAAEGKAEAIRVIKEAGADDKFLALQGLEAFTKMADGKATKLVIPAELKNLATLTGIFGDFIKDPDKNQA
ncbi:MAG: SPFH/Band 7/PHB domain protein [Fusobacteriaceae bacterium]|jgi:regulator of protease activity HflC (stomatin/prohibitin superfamily)|nr:SPFH/Band 7/PHB domain protein [Fusobacteriaceae bacterium]